MSKYFLSLLLVVFTIHFSEAQTAKDYFMSGVKKDQAGDHAGAIEEYSKSIAIDSTKFQTFNNRGISKNDIGDLKGALKDYNKAIELNPKIADTYNNRGNVKDKLKDYKGAIKDYTKAIELDPKNTFAFYRAIAKQHINDKAGACSDFRKAEKLGYSKAKEEIKKNCQ